MGAAAQLARPVAHRTTRTRSPYFSPNRAIAPIARASSWLMTSACTARSATSTSLTVCSTSASTDAGTAPVEAKSKRSRPGAFSDPAWVADSPRASRIAWCTRWVAVWAREIACRRSRSTSACTCAPRVNAPERTRAAVHDQAADGALHVVDLEHRAVVEPDHALVGELPAALGVERGAVEHDLDLGRPPRRRRQGRRARRCRARWPRRRPRRSR